MVSPSGARGLDPHSRGSGAVARTFRPVNWSCKHGWDVLRGSAALVIGGWEMSQRGSPHLRCRAGRLTAAVRGQSDGAQRAVAGRAAGLPCPLQEDSPGPGVSPQHPAPTAGSFLPPFPRRLFLCGRYLCCRSHPQQQDVGTACHLLSAWGL